MLHSTGSASRLPKIEVLAVTPAPPLTTNVTNLSRPSPPKTPLFRSSRQPTSSGEKVLSDPRPTSSTTSRNIMPHKYCGLAARIVVYQRAYCSPQIQETYSSTGISQSTSLVPVSQSSEEARGTGSAADPFFWQPIPPK